MAKQILSPDIRAANAAAEKKMHDAVKYKPYHRYFAGWDATGLAGWWHDVQIAHNEGRQFYVGKIDNATICNVLWKEMSRNPVRWGTVSPFLYDGKESVYRFTSRTDIDATSSLGRVQQKLAYYLRKVGRSHHGSNQWHADIATSAVGTIEYGPFLYKALAALRDTIHEICNQNVADLHAKRGPYRAAMIKLINSQPSVPNFVSLDVYPSRPITPIVDEAYLAELERMDDANDSLDITLSNKDYISEELYLQALADKKQYE